MRDFPFDPNQENQDDAADSSAELKQALKHTVPITPELRRLAEEYSVEADEALDEVLQHHDEATPLSWVDEQIKTHYSKETT